MSEGVKPMCSPNFFGQLEYDEVELVWVTPGAERNICELPVFLRQTALKRARARRIMFALSGTL